MLNLLHMLCRNGTGNNSGSGEFVVIITKSTEAGRFVADKTRAEIMTAYTAGKKIVFLLTIGHTFYQIDDITVKTISDEPWIILREKGCAPHPDLLIIYGPTTDDSEMLYVSSEIEQWNGPIDHVSTSASIPGTVTDTMYNWEFGELSSLTITSFPENGVWRIQFMSGSTPTEITLPQGLLGLDDFEPEANTEYVLELAFGVGYVGIPVEEEEEEEET